MPEKTQYRLFIIMPENTAISSKDGNPGIPQIIAQASMLFMANSHRKENDREIEKFITRNVDDKFEFVRMNESGAIHIHNLVREARNRHVTADDFIFSSSKGVHDCAYIFMRTDHNHVLKDIIDRMTTTI